MTRPSWSPRMAIDRTSKAAVPSRAAILWGSMMTTVDLNIDTHGGPAAELYSLDEALSMIGIAVPTYYRWIKSGKIDDLRLRGPHRKAYLSGEAVDALRAVAMRVDVVPTPLVVTSNPQPGRYA